MRRGSIEIYDDEWHDPVAWKRFLKLVEKRTKDALAEEAKSAAAKKNAGASGDDEIHEIRKQFLAMYNAVMGQARRPTLDAQDSNPYSDIYQMPHWPFGPMGAPNIGPVEGEEDAQLPLDLDADEGDE